MNDHLIFGENRASLVCRACGKFTDRPHVIGMEPYCAGCCGVCNPVAPAERTGAVAGLVGEQEGLF